MANVDKTVVNIPLVREEGTVVTAIALTSDSANNDTETLIITPTGPANKIILIINEMAASTGGTMTVDCKAGGYWAALAMETVSVAVSTSVAIVFQAAAHKDMDDNTIEVMITPEVGSKLATNHGATYQIMQMPD